jgi:hypothetical protein
VRLTAGRCLASVGSCSCGHSDGFNDGGRSLRDRGSTSPKDRIKMITHSAVLFFLGVDGRSRSECRKRKAQESDADRLGEHDEPK